MVYVAESRTLNPCDPPVIYDLDSVRRHGPDGARTSLGRTLSIASERLSVLDVHFGAGPNAVSLTRTQLRELAECGTNEQRIRLLAGMLHGLSPDLPATARNDPAAFRELSIRVLDALQSWNPGAATDRAAHAHVVIDPGSHQFSRITIGDADTTSFGRTGPLYPQGTAPDEAACRPITSPRVELPPRPTVDPVATQRPVLEALHGANVLHESGANIVGLQIVDRDETRTSTMVLDDHNTENPAALRQAVASALRRSGLPEDRIGPAVDRVLEGFRRFPPMLRGPEFHLDTHARLSIRANLDRPDAPTAIGFSHVSPTDRAHEWAEQLSWRFGENLRARETFIPRVAGGQSVAAIRHHTRELTGIMGSSLPYSHDAVADAAFTSAVYEACAVRREEGVTDAAQLAAWMAARSVGRPNREAGSLGAEPSLGPFQAYPRRTAAALENPQVRRWLIAHGDPRAQALAREVDEARPPLSREEIVDELCTAPEGDFAPICESWALSLVGKVALTCEYVRDVDHANPCVRTMSRDQQARIWADAESCADDGMFNRDGLQRAAPGAVPISEGNPNAHATMEALGIAFARGRTLTR